MTWHMRGLQLPERIWVGEDYLKQQEAHLKEESQKLDAILCGMGVSMPQEKLCLTEKGLYNPENQQNISYETLKINGFCDQLKKLKKLEKRHSALCKEFRELETRVCRIIADIPDLPQDYFPKRMDLHLDTEGLHLHNREGKGVLIYHDRVERYGVYGQLDEVRFAMQNQMKAMQEQRDAAAQVPASRLPEAVAVMVDVNSMQRNGLGIVASHQSSELSLLTQLAAKILSVIGGILLIINGLFICKGAFEEGKTAYQHGNIEAGVEAVGLGVAGASNAGLGGILVGSCYSLALLPLLVLGIIMYAAVAIVGLFGITITGAFRWTLNQKLEAKEQSESARLCETLKWIRAQVALSDEEKKQIFDAGGGLAEIEKTLQKKWDQFAFRTNEATCSRVRREVTLELIARLEREENVTEADVELARSIVHEVSKANFEKVVQYVLLAIIAIVGFVCFWALMAVTTGPLGPALFFVAAILWLGIDSKDVQRLINRILWGLRNSICSESIDQVQRKTCQKVQQTSLPISSLTSGRRGDYPNIPSRHTGETLRNSRVSSRRRVGIASPQTISFHFSRTSRKRHTHRPLFAASSSQ